MTTASRKDAPHILLICTDQQRWNALGAAGNDEISTPNLDRLAGQGARFTNCYVQSPVCAPSRASLMTGQYVHTHGLWANGVDLPTPNRQVTEQLAGAGYDCGLVGKYHLAACFDGRTEHAPPGMRAFRWAHDPYRGSSENAYHRWLAATHPEVHAAATAGEISWDEVPTEAHYSRWIGNETVEWLTTGRRRDQPFFFIANFFDPHHGFGAPTEYRDRYVAEDLSRPVTVDGELDTKPSVHTEASQKSYAGHARGFAECSAAELQEIKAAYYAMVTLVDDEVGRILDTLDAEGLADDTLVIFTSDHGEMLGDHQLLLKGPMLYDVAVKVPLLIRLPGVTGEGVVIDELVQWIDLTRTLTDVAGCAALPAGQGIGLLELASGAEVPHRGWALSEYRNSGHAYDSPSLLTMVRRDDTKIIIHHGEPATDRRLEGELYDLASDPDELINLWSDPASATLRAEMTAFALDVLVATENRSAPRLAHW
ncbi:sulfatase family protein [Propionibacteriaceae bacterium Y1700]|uniref:sulfatase family protein n=1 Tax=Microlunatus sp. Y1700 TaxID=3418487 RepID=UPI003DA7648F